MTEIVCVKWLDTTGQDGWRNASYVRKAPCLRIISWGEILHENEERIVLVANKIASGQGEEQWGDATLIPHVQIISITTYEMEP